MVFGEVDKTVVRREGVRWQFGDGKMIVVEGGTKLAPHWGRGGVVLLLTPCTCVSTSVIICLLLRRDNWTSFFFDSPFKVARTFHIAPQISS